MRILITGGAGFIGHHLVRHLLQHTDHELTLIDRLDWSGNLNRLAEVTGPWMSSKRVKFVFHDLRAAINDLLASQIGPHDVIVHMAAGTHVDRSITNPMEFVLDNVVGTCNILDFAVKVGCGKFLQFSTDEVFGPAPPGVAYREDDRYRSGNPYAATKAGAEELAISYYSTYKLPVIVTHTMNVIGERQHPEKFVPMSIAKIMHGKKIMIHADSTLTVPGSRFYINARLVAEAVLFLLRNGIPGEKYNICGTREIDNLQLIKEIYDAFAFAFPNLKLEPLSYELVDFHSSRPGHDLRYALDGSKLRDMGFVHSGGSDDLMLKDLVDWYVNHQDWLLLGGS